MARKKKVEQEIDYFDFEFDFAPRKGRVTERNGNLSYVEDSETGQGSWLAPHEIGDNW
jgi:hypothetical protein